MVLSASMATEPLAGTVVLTTVNVSPASGSLSLASTSMLTGATSLVVAVSSIATGGWLGVRTLKDPSTGTTGMAWGGTAPSLATTSVKVRGLDSPGLPTRLKVISAMVKLLTSAAVALAVIMETEPAVLSTFDSNKIPWGS